MSILIIFAGISKIQKGLILESIFSGWLLSRGWKNWKSVLIVVNPETVINQR